MSVDEPPVWCDEHMEPYCPRHQGVADAHPCPLPAKRFWRWGRSWMCVCGREYWLVEKYHMDDPGDHYSEWRWVAGDTPIAGQLFRSWER